MKKQYDSKAKLFRFGPWRNHLGKLPNRCVVIQGEEELVMKTDGHEREHIKCHIRT